MKTRGQQQRAKLRAFLDSTKPKYEPPFWQGWSEHDKLNYIFEQYGEQFRFYNSMVTFSTDDKLFVIVQNHEDLSAIHAAYNYTFHRKDWERWVNVYRRVHATGWDKDHPFSSLRLGREYTNTFDGRPPFLVPHGIVELDKVCDWGFADEYDTCSNCGRSMRTAPDCYGWQPDFFDFKDGDRLCRDCIREHAVEEYIEEHINRNKLLNEWIVNPEDHDWTKLDLDYENGMHPGQNDDPRKIIKVLKAEGIDVLFTGSVGQFDVDFSPWVRTQLLEEGEGWCRTITSEAMHILENTSVKLPYDPGTEMAKALKGEPSQYYKREKVVPGLCDQHFEIKPTEAA